MGNTYATYGAYTDREKSLVDVRLAQGHSYEDIVEELEKLRTSPRRKRLAKQQLLSPRIPIDRSRTCGNVNITAIGNAYTKRELVNLAVQNGYSKTQAQKLKKDRLCRLLLSLEENPFTKLPRDVSSRIYSELYSED